MSEEYIRDLQMQAMAVDKVLEEIKDEILKEYSGCELCIWDRDYDFDDNDISEYRFVANIDDIIDIIDKHMRGEQNDRISD